MSRADLEGRFVKRFSPRQFALLLNSSEGVADAVRSELTDAVQNLLDNVDPNIRFTVNLDNQDAELAVITAPRGKALHRALYQQSKFFKHITVAYLSRKRGLVLHEQLDVVGAAEERTIDDLDPFNQYVLLHFLPYIQKCAQDEVNQDADSKSRESLNEVVIDKISCLRENSDEH